MAVAILRVDVRSVLELKRKGDSLKTGAHADLCPHNSIFWK